MADFAEIRDQLRLARDARDGAAADVARTVQALKRLATERTALDRRADAHSDEATGRRKALEAREKELRATLDSARERRRALDSAALDLSGRFAAFTDPRKGINRLDDDTPLLLMPLRLETRFKRSAPPGAAPRDELWVRVFPDDCWIDSFDPILTEGEVASAAAYWRALWASGGDPALDRAAWTTLATGHGANRAAWIVRSYKPTNLAERPVRLDASDVFLPITLDSALAPGEATALAAFWRAVWVAAGDATAVGVATTTLELAVGAARAAELIAAHVPANLDAAPPDGVSREDVTVSVPFLLLPSVETKRETWSQAPRARILPDRFVFVGYERENDPTPVTVVGGAVASPLQVGPDPTAPESEQLRHDAEGNLIVPDELLWLTDFDRAVQVGMGMRVPLTPSQAANGFARVLVVGVRLNATADVAQQELETLFSHHRYSSSGLAILPQGTPTNNTEAQPAGYDRFDDADAAFDDAVAPLFAPASAWRDKRDGEWLAQWLGIDPSLLANVHGAGTTDQRVMRAMHTALWPATLGYWMESMMSPVFSDEVVERTREFFTQHVIPGGAVPVVRIGAQPYGILPTTAFSRMRWFEPRPSNDRLALVVERDPMLAWLRAFYPILRTIDDDFRSLARDVAHVGKPGDPHALLLDVVGLHPGSVDWVQRHAEHLKTLYNRLSLQGFGGKLQALITAFVRQQARARLTTLGYSGDKDPPILDLIFNRAHNQLTGGVVDAIPVSETQALRAATTDGRNYLRWLLDASSTSLDALYAQAGFTDDRPPSSLLYLFLRHALQLGYHDTGIRLHQRAGLYDATAMQRARQDDPFLHVRAGDGVSESRYQPLYERVPGITGSPTLSVHEFIAASLTTLADARNLTQQRAALAVLEHESTARLERAFADHIDACSYRLDAWLLGYVHVQLARMRGLSDGSAQPARRGIYLGGYAWLERLVPDKRTLIPVRLDDPALAKEFTPPGATPLLRDSTNQGYVHAPSLNHAVAAAVLRNGFISNASPANRQALAVNLTSERVRVALAMIEGIRGGQSLADLLGYQFERGLHDRHGLAEVDKFIYKLRRAFPLRADRMASTKPPEGVSIEAIEARNVVNGLSLVEHVKATGNAQYPFGKATLPPASATEAAAIDAEVDRLLESHDAVADLALSEGVYQAVLGNYDRVASTYDAYAHGAFPPEPDIIRTPSVGTGLTHRVALHLDAGVSHLVSPVPPIAMTPRAQAEPAVNAWLATVLPRLDEVACMVQFREAATGLARSRQVTLHDLGLQPADVLALVGDDDSQAMGELDDRIVRRALDAFGARPDLTPTIGYREKDTAPYSIFECLPLLRALRTLVGGSRPLRATDLTLMNEASSTQDATPFVDRARLDAVVAAMTTLRNDWTAFLAPLGAELADTVANRAALIAATDARAAAATALLARTATCAVPQAGWGFVRDFTQRTYAAILAQCATVVERWDAKLVEFNARLVDEAAATTDEARFDLLAQAERAISTVMTVPLPATPALYRTTLTTVTEPAFSARRALLDAIKASTRTALVPLLGDVQGLLPVSDFDSEPFTLAAHEDEMIRFAEDVGRMGGAMITELGKRLDEGAVALAAHDVAAAPADRVAALQRCAQALLGQACVLVPQFTPSNAKGSELAMARADAQSGATVVHLTAPADPAVDPVDDPVDTWLYGTARVRAKMRAWEGLVMHAGSLGRGEPVLDALQLPYAPGDAWLGLELPPGAVLDRDRLLYTAHFAAGFTMGTPQCGLLLDEWTEVIPGDSIETGLAFHYDRPNNEAPQSMLLVTPTEFRGAWQWEDVIDALNETLDLAKRRAVEPKHVDASPYGPYLPATVIATQASQLTIALELAINNRIALATS